MKLAFLSDLWLNFPGGAERLMANVSQAMMDRGHETHVLTGYALAVPVHCTSLSIRTDIGVSSQSLHHVGVQIINEFLEQHKPDCIFTHHFYAKEFPEIWDANIPVVEFIYNHQRHEKTAMGIYCSQYSADKQGYKEGDMVILPPAGPNIVADTHGECIGQVKPTHGKGIDFTYDLAAMLPDREFLILRGEWQNCEDIRDIPNVSYMEPVADMRDFYKECDLILMPSRSEEAGTVPQEATLNGLPCISSNVGGLPETNKGGIVLPHDLNAWVQAITHLDYAAYYSSVVSRQRAHVTSLNWPKQFNTLNKRIKAICAK